MRAPRSSAAYSRVRLIAICTSMAPSGARIISAIEPMMPGPLLLSRWPPKNMPNCASIEIAPAMVHQRGGDGDRRVLGVSAGRKGSGLGFIHHEHARHREAGARGKLGNE